MFSSRDAFENDFCPVRDELLGEMYRANANGLPLLVESVSSETRAMLALFCYRRSHLHSLAVAIASVAAPAVRSRSASGRSWPAIHAVSAGSPRSSAAPARGRSTRT